MDDRPDDPAKPQVPASELSELTTRIMEQLTPDVSKMLDEQFATAKQGILEVLARSGGVAADRVREQIADVLRPNAGLAGPESQTIQMGIAEERDTALPLQIVYTEAHFGGSGHLSVTAEVVSGGVVGSGAAHAPEVRVTKGDVPNRVSSDEVLRHAGTIADLWAVYQLLSEDDPRTIVLRAMLVATLLGLLIALHGKRPG